MTTAKTDRQTFVRSADRALSVLEVLNRSKLLGEAEISRQSGVSRGATRRMLSTLEHRGYVKRDSSSKTYRLTSRALDLSNGYRCRDILIDTAMPVIREAYAEVEWPLILTRLYGHQMEILVGTEDNNPLATHVSHAGQCLPIIESAAGHAVIVSASEAFRKTYLQEVRQSGIDPQKSASFQLKTNMINGTFAFYQNPNASERSLAVPILKRGEAVGGLSAHYMAAVVSDASAIKKILPVLKSSAERIGQKLSAMDADFMDVADPSLEWQAA